MVYSSANEKFSLSDRISGAAKVSFFPRAKLTGYDDDNGLFIEYGRVYIAHISSLSYRDNVLYLLSHSFSYTVTSGYEK